jgi:hypothetical protein
MKISFLARSHKFGRQQGAGYDDDDDEGGAYGYSGYSYGGSGATYGGDDDEEDGMLHYKLNALLKIVTF